MVSEGSATSNEGRVCNQLQLIIRQSNLSEADFGRVLERDPGLVSLGAMVAASLIRLGASLQPVDSDLLEAIDLFRQDGIKTADYSVSFFDKANPLVRFAFIDGDLLAYSKNAGLVTDVPAANVRISMLRKGTTFEPVQRELGDKEAIAPPLAFVQQWLTDQGQGQNGRLITRYDRSNIVPTPDGRSFYASYGVDGWHCGLIASPDVFRWSAGSQVLYL